MFYSMTKITKIMNSTDYRYRIFKSRNQTPIVEESHELRLILKRCDENSDVDKENNVNHGNNTSIIPISSDSSSVDVEFVSESTASSGEKQIKRLNKKIIDLKNKSSRRIKRKTRSAELNKSLI